MAVRRSFVSITTATLLCLQETWPLLKNTGNIKLEKHSLFPQQPSKDCNNSPSMPDSTIKTNRSVLISGMQTTRRLINIQAYLETWSKILFWSKTRMRVRDFQKGSERETESLYLVVMLCEMLGRKMSLLLYLRMEEGLHTCHDPFPLHDASCHRGNHVISRSRGSHFHVVLSGHGHK